MSLRAAPGASAGAVTVSVAIVTYNHERFIAQALDSVLAQQTDFPFEVVVGEDCSTDATREIVREYQQRFPDTIRLLAHPRNVGTLRNFVATLARCTGTYIALLDGDDYWTAPRKLQLQVDFLEAHPDYAICFHNAAIAHGQDAAGDETVCPADQKETSSTVDLLRSLFVPTSSVVLRRAACPELPDWIHDLNTSGDWTLLTLASQHGAIGYINQVMSVYRIHPSGLWSRQSPAWRLREIIRFYEYINPHLRFRYDRIVRQRLGDTRVDLAWEYVRDDQLAGACRSALSACRYGLRAAAGTARPHWLRLTALGASIVASALRRAAARTRRRAFP